MHYKIFVHRSALLLILILSYSGDPRSVLGDDEKPLAVVVVGTQHYSPHLSMPLFAKELERHGFRVKLVMGNGDPEKKQTNVLPEIELLDQADVAIFFMRFLKLPDDEWNVIERYLKSAKPVVGLRTTNHAFKYPSGHPREKWNDDFGRNVLGTPYIVHQASKSNIRAVEKYKNHQVFKHLDLKPWVSSSKLYLTRLETGCVPLLTGDGTGKARLLEKPFGVIQVNESESDVVAWTWKNRYGAKVFSTTLGHPDDFGEEQFTRLLLNGVCWAANVPLPGADAKVSTWKILASKKKKANPARQSKRKRAK